MTDNSLRDSLANAIRRALGPHDDLDLPVVVCVQRLVERCAAAREEGRREEREAHAAQLVALRGDLERIIGMCAAPPHCSCGRPNGLPAVVACAERALEHAANTPDAEAALEKVREGAVRDFLAKEPGGGYEVAAPFEGGPLTRVRRRGLQGHEWGFAYPEQARAVANALNALGAKS